MCGIFGYVGTKNALPLLIDGLKRLEYRGYDSCGVALAAQDKVIIKKRSGRVHALEASLQNSRTVLCTTGIAHTRWATHGAPTQPNAHPHRDCLGSIALVHNGIIENHDELKRELLAKKHKFSSATDTEVIAHLLEELMRKGKSFENALQETIQRLKGSFALGILSRDAPGKIWAVKKESPLIIGISRNGMFLSSDPSALLPFTNQVFYLDDSQYAVLEQEHMTLRTFSGQERTPKISCIVGDARLAQKDNFEHFMLKEIHEQPAIIEKILSLYVAKGRVFFGKDFLPETFLKKIKTVRIVACGTAYHAGFTAKYLLEKALPGVHIEVDVSSELRYRQIRFTQRDLVIAVSQSGETADTLAAVKQARVQGARVLGVCNVLGSTLARFSDALLYTAAGPEIGVASTKAYTAQLLCLMLFYLFCGRIFRTIPPREIQQYLAALRNVAPLQREILCKQSAAIRKISHSFAHFGSFLFLGRGIHYPTALEGALKLKEISYIPAEGYAAGEMKHGPIALIDEYRVVVCVAPKDALYEKMISNIQEIKARKGKVFVIATEEDPQFDSIANVKVIIPKLFTPALPLITVLPLQLFAYFVARKLGREIDKPRNLAKSVTVE